MIKTSIADGNGGFIADVVRRVTPGSQYKSPSGLMVYTEPYEYETNRPISAVDENGSTNLNVNGLISGGSPDSIHDGTDTALWTGSNLVGTNFVFNSTDQAQAGTRSVDGSATINGDEALFTRSSPITQSDYSALQGFIWIDSWPTAGTKEIRFRFRLGGTDVSSIVDLSPFINTGDTGTWQSFTIPLQSNFNIVGTQIDEMVITTIDIGGGQPPNYYLDTMSLASAAGGEPKIFTIKPRAAETVFFKGIEFTFVFPFTGITTVAGATENATLPRLTYNSFCHLSELANGITIRRIQQNVTGFSSVIRNNFDLLEATNRKINYFFSDGTNAMLKISSEFAGNVELDSRFNDRYEFVINDDLTSLLEFRLRGLATTVNRLESPTATL